jgi:hypothetical protein
MTQNSPSTVHITPGCDISCKSIFSKQNPLHISSSKNLNLNSMTVFFCKKRERVILWLLLSTKVDMILYVAWRCIMAVSRGQVAMSGQSGGAWLCMRRSRPL